ncbi:HAD-IIIA family hydrolase [Yimella sp. cx-573]|nr:HAD-IIIA family hydrolase [Yimella sp. cx-573]
MPLTDVELLGTVTDRLPEPARRGRFDLVLLDRDGTLNVHRPGYIEHPADLQIIPGAQHAVAALNAAGIPVVVVTNQQGVGKKVMTSADLVAVHRALERGLQPGRLDGFAVCPHLAGSCTCRKPATGLFEQVLTRAPWADPRRCVMIGDADTDLAPALRLGMAAVKVGGECPPFDQHVVQRLLNCDVDRTEAATVR